MIRVSVQEYTLVRYIVLTDGDTLEELNRTGALLLVNPTLQPLPWDESAFFFLLRTPPGNAGIDA